MNRFSVLFPAVLLLAVAGAGAQTLPGANVHGTAARAADRQTVSQPVLPSVPGDGRQGTVKTVHGTVAIVNGRTRHAAAEGDAIWQNEQIAAGPDSSAAVTLRDGTVVSVGPNSVVELTYYRFEPTTNDGNIGLSLIKGSLRVVTGLITRTASEAGPARVKVTTPTAVIGIRGTDAIVDINP